MIKMIDKSIFWVKNNASLVSTIALVLVGIYIRTNAYLFNSSIWNDEANLLSGVLSKDYLQSFLSLQEGEQSPPIFSLITKFMYNSYGVNEYALRLFPFLCSIVGLILFAILCNKFFKSKIAANIGISIFAINPAIIYFSQITKFYSSDILLSILFLIGVCSLKIEKISAKNIFLYGLLSSVLIWASYPLIFTISGFFITLFIKSIIEKNKSNVKKLFLYIIPISISFIAFYILHLYSLTNSPWLNEQWKIVYGFFPNTYFEINSTLAMLFYSDNYFPKVNILQYTAVASLLIIGYYNLIKKNKWKAILISSPIITTLIAGGLHIYPCANRPVLFLLPMLILIATAAFTFEKSKIDKILKTAVIILFIVYFSSIFNSNIFKYITNKYDFSKADGRDHFEKVSLHHNKEDNIYVDFDLIMAFKIYERKFKFPEETIKDLHFFTYKDRLGEIKANQYIWLIYQNDIPDTERLNYLKSWENQHCIVKEDFSNKRINVLRCLTK